MPRSVEVVLAGAASSTEDFAMGRDSTGTSSMTSLAVGAVDSEALAFVDVIALADDADEVRVGVGFGRSSWVLVTIAATTSRAAATPPAAAMVYVDRLRRAVERDATPAIVDNGSVGISSVPGSCGAGAGRSSPS
ncbi:MAG: hypothetical protein ACLQVI_01780 [Polyangiaceae bacterium]